MAGGFSIVTTAHFDRLAKALNRRHPRVFMGALQEALGTLESDPYNVQRRFAIKKLTDVRPGEGQYRLRMGRFRFRYDISKDTVTLVRCSLRRESTYR
jgi:mRNA-degrading endonuclease RelE of RelBE toxin-antitoxin system